VTVREAEQHAAEDKKRRELVELRNQADAAIYTAEKQVQEHGGRVAEAERKVVEDALAALRQAVTSEDAGQIRQRLSELSAALTRFEVSAQQGAAASAQSAEGPAGEQGGRSNEDNVVDAEFSEVDGGGQGRQQRG
jgi:molecular chaperone DnaK